MNVVMLRPCMNRWQKKNWMSWINETKETAKLKNTRNWKKFAPDLKTVPALVMRQASGFTEMELS